MACNRIQGAGDNEILPPNPNLSFTLKKAELAVFDHQVNQLYRDFEIVIGLAEVCLCHFHHFMIHKFMSKLQFQRITIVENNVVLYIYILISIFFMLFKYIFAFFLFIIILFSFSF